MHDAGVRQLPLISKHAIIVLLTWRPFSFVLPAINASTVLHHPAANMVFALHSQVLHCAVGNQIAQTPRVPTTAPARASGARKTQRLYASETGNGKASVGEHSSPI